MVRPNSLDLRERVVAAVEGGQCCRAVADTFGASVANVAKQRDEVVAPLWLDR